MRIKEWYCSVALVLTLLSICWSIGATENDQKVLDKTPVKTVQLGSEDVYDRIDIHKQPSLDSPLLKGHTAQLGSDDVYDCIDIHKQPSLDSPLLKGHTVQMEPTSIANFPIQTNSASTASSHAHIVATRCPSGTVPIWRENKSKVAPYLLPNHPNEDPNVSYTTIRGSKKMILQGARASISLHAPKGVGPTQSTGAMLWIKDIKTLPFADQIGAGWMVDPEMYHDHQPRLTIFYHMANGSGCVNTLCPGFVQTNPNIPLGAPFANISSDMGVQYYYTIQIFADQKTKNWWLWCGEHNQPVGYWPRELFAHFSGYANGFSTGGRASSRRSEAGPPMGSGRYPAEGFRHAAFVEHILAISTSTGHPVTYSPYIQFSTVYDTESCYGVGRLVDGGDSGLGFYYGGPGGCNCHVLC